MDSSKTERERILERMAEAIQKVDGSRLLHEPILSYTQIADICLRVIETPMRGNETYSKICNCGQNGYNPGSWHSNHDHLEGCPHYVQQS